MAILRSVLMIAVSILAVDGSVKMLATDNACFSATQFLTAYDFHAPADGEVVGVELEYRSGGITCNFARSLTKWGCNGHYNDWLMVNFLEYGDDGSDSAIFPSSTMEGMTSFAKYGSCSNGHGCSGTFKMSAYTYDSATLVMKDEENPFTVTTADIFSLQMSEGCCGTSTGDNVGVSCAKVYFLYSRSVDNYVKRSCLDPNQLTAGSRGDYGYHNGQPKSLAECKALCAQDEECMSFAFSEAGQKCHLKDQPSWEGCDCADPSSWNFQTYMCSGCSGRRPTPVECPLRWSNWSPSHKLSICEGDCDSDAHCLSGNCIHNAIPSGCTGTNHGGSIADYCGFSMASTNAAASSNMYGPNEMTESGEGGKSFNDTIPMILGATVGAVAVAAIVTVVVVTRTKKAAATESVIEMKAVHVPDDSVATMANTEMEEEEDVMSEIEVNGTGMVEEQQAVSTPDAATMDDADEMKVAVGPSMI